MNICYFRDDNSVSILSKNKIKLITKLTYQKIWNSDQTRVLRGPSSEKEGVCLLSSYHEQDSYSTSSTAQNLLSSQRSDKPQIHFLLTDLDERCPEKPNVSKLD